MAQRNAGSGFGALSEIIQNVQLTWRLMNDPRVPAWLKLIIPAVIVYVISPIDLIPELFIPLIGELDDIAVVVFGIRFFIDHCPPDVVEEHRRAMSGQGRGGRGEYVDGTYRVLDPDEEPR